MLEEKVKEAMRKNAVEPDGGFDQRIDLAIRHLTGKKAGKRIAYVRWTAVFAAALVLTLGMSTGLAALNEDANQLLYQIWPRAALALRPVNLSCESQGIRMEVVSASLAGSQSLITLTVQDLEGDRVDETMDLFDSAQLQLPYDGAGTCVQTGYDPETKTAAFAVSMDFKMDRPLENEKASFTVSRFLSHKREQTIDLTRFMAEGLSEQETMPLPALRGGAENIPEEVRVLDTQNSLEIPLTEGVTFTGIGLVNGRLHVQIRYTDILHTDNHGFLTLKDKSENALQEGDHGIGSVSWFGENHDSWEEYMFDLPAMNPSQLLLTGDFVTASPAIEGDWRVTFPLSMIQPDENL